MYLRNIKDRLEHYSIPEPMSGCWIWTATTNGKNGYGLISVRTDTGVAKNSQDYAHRVSWQFHRGPIPLGKIVLHKCDNTFCINPDHLYLGTHADNRHDVVIRNRRKSALTNESVLEIRKSTLSCRKLAKIYGVCASMIWNIKSCRNWKHI